MRKILGDGLRVPHCSDTRDDYLEMFVLGESNRPQAPFAKEPVVEITADGERYVVPVKNVLELLNRAGFRTTPPA